MLVLGIDIGTSSVKVSVVDANRQQVIATAHYPDTESPILSLQTDIMRENGMSPTVIRAGRSNIFLSNVFTQSFVSATGVPVELYDNDGSMGAALGAGIGVAIFPSADEAFVNLKATQRIEPAATNF